MAMGRCKNRTRTPGLWIAANELPRPGGHPFYLQLNQVLDAHAFDEFVEAQCAPFYAETVGRPSLTPGTYFRLLLVGYFEGLDSERGIAWRTALDPHIGFINTPGFVGWLEMPAQPLLEFRPVALHPAPDRRVVSFQAAFIEELFDIAERE